MKRYHKEVFFEVGVVDEIKNMLKNMDLRPTRHFMKSWMQRGNVCIPTKQIIEAGEIFEYYRNKRGGVEKFAVRCCNVSKDYDVIYVINLYGELVTSWVNTKSELHRDMRRDVYEGGNILPSERVSSTQGNEKGSRRKTPYRKWKSIKHCSSR